MKLTLLLVLPLCLLAEDPKPTDKPETVEQLKQQLNEKEAEVQFLQQKVALLQRKIDAQAKMSQYFLQIVFSDVSVADQQLQALDQQKRPPRAPTPTPPTPTQ